MHTYIHTYIRNTCTRIYIYTHTYILIHIHTDTHMHACMYVYIHTYNTEHSLCQSFVLCQGRAVIYIKRSQLGLIVNNTRQTDCSVVRSLLSPPATRDTAVDSTPGGSSVSMYLSLQPQWAARLAEKNVSGL
jgi:hypothetical protein